MNTIRNFIASNLINTLGPSINEKIVVIESDDWGSIRMPSKYAYESLLKKGIPVNKSAYCRYDNICSDEDLDALFSLLYKHNDFLGNHPCITANVVVGNPDFRKIKESEYNNYFYETIDKTLDRFFPKKKILTTWKDGLNEKIFIPQFHGREHVNVSLWLSALKEKDPVFTEAFKYGCWGISLDVYNKYPKSIQASFDYNNKNDLVFLRDSIRDGLNIFEDLFGYRSKSFIPNNFCWTPELDDELIQNGVEYMQGMKIQSFPTPIGEIRKKNMRRYTGKKFAKNDGLIQIVRNVRFEPSLLSDMDKSKEITTSLRQIENAFFWNKPAVISIHRINFCGTLNLENRIINLRLFDRLLKEIKKRWPDVIFLDTVSLAEKIK